MKKLLLLPLVAIGLALVPAKQADAQVSVGIGGVGSALVIPDIVTATDTRGMATDTRGMGITRAATTAITAVIHLTERLITLDGRTTTAAIGLQAS